MSTTQMPVSILLQYIKDNGVELIGDANGITYTLLLSCVGIENDGRLKLTIDLIKSILTN